MFGATILTFAQEKDQTKSISTKSFKKLTTSYSIDGRHNIIQGRNGSIAFIDGY